MKFIPQTARLVGLLIVLAPAVAAAQSISPWLPIPGSTTVSAGYVGQSADSAYVGDTNLPVAGITGGAATKYNRSSFGVNVVYGIADSLSVDGTISRGTVKVGAADNSSGLQDSIIGLNWRVLDEYEKRNAPTITVRFTGIIGGNYDGAKLAALGKDSSGFGIAAIVGRQFTPVVRAWGSVGYEKRGDSVPAAVSVDVNVGLKPISALDITAGYVSKKYSGSLDIGGPGFSPAAFQQVKEERQLVKLGASYAIAKNQSISASFAKVIDGRNTVNDDRILGVNYSIGF